MARDRGKKALYEVMSKARIKPGAGVTLPPPHPKRPEENKSAAEEKSAAGVPDVAAQWLRRPRTVQFNAGRIEFSMPYQLAVVLVLGLILVALIAFRLGRASYLTAQGTAGSAEEMPVEEIGQESLLEQATVDTMQPPALVEDISPGETAAELVEPVGNNVIVLVEYGARRDLIPVQEHFAEYGIETEIVMEGGRFFLITKDTYDNPGKPGTDGYEAKQRIIEVGAEYKGKAPAGYESFAPHFFRDAYGKKIK